MRMHSLLRYIPSPFDKKIEGREHEEALSREAPVYHLDEEDASVRPLTGMPTKLGQHWAIVGKTGSGKTRFALGLLGYLRRSHPKTPRYVLNSTDDDMPEIHAPLTVRGNQSPDVMTDGTYTQVWTPDSDDLDEYNEWFLKILYRRQPAIVLIDEIASLSGRSRNATLEGHIKLLKQGRKHGITVINETQSLSHVPLDIFRQMEYYVQFRINNDVHEVSTSRRYLDVDKKEYHQPNAPYGFFLKRSGLHTVKEYRSMRELFGNVG